MLPHRDGNEASGNRPAICLDVLKCVAVLTVIVYSVYSASWGRADGTRRYRSGDDRDRAAHRSVGAGGRPVRASQDARYTPGRPAGHSWRGRPGDLAEDRA